ncbi:endolytic transglycosylase MltG [Candidatus Peribacteria bacterium]|nr:MAG: endolytic transglycosylase MltG [Candidatus Peribacteria bacterium]
MKKLIVPVVLLFVAFVAARGWYTHALSPVDASDVRTVFTVEKGASTATIANNLEEQNLIRSAFAFKMHVKLSGQAGELKAGSFVLTSSMSAEEVVQTLAGGKSTEEIITIPEGFTVEDIDAMLAEKEIIKAGDLQNCARTCDFSAFDFLPTSTKLAPRGGKIEGYLYPDTYYITAAEFDPKLFIERLLHTFRDRVIKDLAADIKASGRSLEQIVTVASLVEEETRTAAERPVVSGIIWKRLDERMVLGIDAAVRYVVDKPTSAITQTDLQTDSPYNLRKFAGLPPGPIANPSLSSIKAALHPQASPYYYYLHGSDGVIRYAVTNDEHNVNRAKYLQ